MKRIPAVLSLLLIIGLVFYSFFSLMPQNGTPKSISKTEFSTERALEHLHHIAQKPHYHGSEEHKVVRNYLMEELKKLGLQPQTQEGFVFNPQRRTMDRPINIVARMEGTSDGKALVLLSHYDSALVPSPGASDAGSGIATILESLRAYQATGEKPKNDIIILFTDAEEIGLDGAKLFVNEHPWAKDVGLVLNFEARGSGGPSNMILETNGGNKKLVQAFIEADPDYPVASSLMYSVYKMLPNDTDSTIFRENGDIPSYFFAFIDDHFDYHTANDTIENLDIETLQHQGSYLLPLLHYFANADLSNLKSQEDYVYVNFPFLKMISFPFLWILPLLLVAIALFAILVFYGFKKEKLTGKAIAKGFVPFLLSLVVCGAIGLFGWKLMVAIYPQYNEIQHGFKYNGHDYVAFFVLLSLSITFYLYRRFANRTPVASVYVAPLLFWMLINVAVFVVLKGAAYFIIPVFFGLLSFWVLIRQEKPNLPLMALLAAPALFFFSPLIQFFPVGLGSQMVVISCVFTVLLFGLLLPVFGFYRWKKFLSVLCFLFALGFFVKAHLNSGFSKMHQKPNSLIYYQDQDNGQSYWLTYDKLLDRWTKGYLGENPQHVPSEIIQASGSKYNTGYTYAAEAPKKPITPFKVLRKRDTISNPSEEITFTILPKRTINQLNLYADTDVTFTSLSFNGQKVPKDSTGLPYGNRKNELLLRYWVNNNDSLKVSYTTEQQKPVSFTALEFSYDLMDHENFSIHQRPSDMMPKPFVVTDAIVIKRTFAIDELPNRKKDSLTFKAQKKSTK
ncbi:M20/M25/M40 family metallo-hydrolase [Marixanthomonas spongiae]|uniref:Vacuolar membrane protease n=1 Tax=Marixanthomonas spongiae TaxID=2174845 RepID=A0A2U0I2E7_9FLAO|nr:M20/M25/M40 family metallo-hydrolase [Marixanthomonas spongiae]PVW15291.1 peptidase M28 [Marixanthomonas spongiae]